MKDCVKCRVQAEEYWRIDLLALMWCGFSRRLIRENFEDGRGSSSSVVMRVTEGCSDGKRLEFYKAFELISDACEQDKLPHDGYEIFSRTVMLRDFRRWVKRNHSNGAAGEFFDEPEPGTESGEPTNLQVTRLSEMAWRNRVITVFEAAMIWCRIPEEDLVPAHLAYKGVYLEGFVDQDLYEEYVQKREEMKQAMRLVVEGHRESVAKKHLDEGSPKKVENWTVSQGAFFDWVGSNYPDDVKNLHPHVAPIMTEAEQAESHAEAKSALEASGSNDKEVQQDRKPPIQSALNDEGCAARIHELETQLANTKNRSLDKRKEKSYGYLIRALVGFIEGEGLFASHPDYKSTNNLIEQIVDQYGEYHGISIKSVRDKINYGRKLTSEEPIK